MHRTMSENGTILAVNAGSSSLKFAAFAPRDFRRVASGQLEGIGTHPRLAARIDGRTVAEDWGGSGAGDAPALVRRLTGWIEEHVCTDGLAAIGHRVAVGGLAHSGPVRITPQVLTTLRSLVPLAPLHQPRNLEPIEVLGASHPDVPQVACFDTAFHRTIPREAALYGLPRALTEAGAQRFGFHGLSYEYIARQLPALDPRAAAGRTIVCHLGSGASLCALRGGHSIATTMGFSPLSGLVMATRPGELDPGLVIWLLRERGMTVDQVENLLYRESGLKGVSGLTGDMRELLQSADPGAKEAVELFTYTIATQIGRLTAALGGLDAIVFTAGIGANSPDIRRAVAARSEWLGLKIDAARNDRNEIRISRPDSAVSVLAIPTDEERIVAEHTARLVLEPAGARRSETT